jgi:hypothetical protein
MAALTEQELNREYEPIESLRIRRIELHSNKVVDLHITTARSSKGAESTPRSFLFPARFLTSDRGRSTLARQPVVGTSRAQFE